MIISSDCGNFCNTSTSGFCSRLKRSLLLDVLSFFNSREVFILKLPIQAALSKIILHSSLSWDEDDEQQHRLTAPPSCVTACVTVSIQPILLHLLLLLMSNYWVYWQCLQCWQCWNYWIGFDPIKSNPTDPPLATSFTSFFWKATVDIIDPPRGAR